MKDDFIATKTIAQHTPEKQSQGLTGAQEGLQGLTGTYEGLLGPTSAAGAAMRNQRNESYRQKNVKDQWKKNNKGKCGNG